VKLVRALALPCCAVVAAGVTGCFSTPPRPQILTPEPAPATAPPATSVPDAVPRTEPRSRNGNPPFYDVFGKRYFVLSSSVGYVERGVASWYGPGFHKVRTSIGEPYDMYGMTAAHKTLPLPAYVRVTNLQNGRSVVVRVNDRGPFVGNRIIDLSYTAASKLDMLRNGTAMVEVRSLDAPPTLNAATTNAAAPVDAPVTAAGFAPAATPQADSPSGTVSFVAVPAPGSLFIQAGAFSDPKNAERLVERLRGGAYGKVFVRDNEIAGRRMYRVRIGPVPDVAEFDRIVAALERVGIHDAHLALD
jgi:rare lipoprotein A